jgi:transposase-like protein
MHRIPPSQQIQEAIHQLLTEGLTAGATDVTRELLRLGAQRLVQELLEQEVADVLGRGPYERDGSHGARGYRNGYRPATIKTAEGAIPVAVPQVRNTPEPFHSQIKEWLDGTDTVNRLAVEMYAKGLSTRDIEAAFTTATGERLLSHTAVSEVTEALWQEYEAFQQRSLADLPILYLFLDAVYEPMRRTGSTTEAVLAAWGVAQDGRKVLLSLSVGHAETYDAWRDFLRDLVRRGLPCPLTITTDGAPGLIQAVERQWPRALRIRCWAHKTRNVLSRVPEAVPCEVKQQLYAIRDAADYATGLQRYQDVYDRLARAYPSAARSLEEDHEALLAHLKVPVRHRIIVRTTNLIERCFEEEQRRTKVLPRFWSEKSALKLIFGAVIRATQHWRVVGLNAEAWESLQALWEQHPPYTASEEEILSATASV